MPAFNKSRNSDCQRCKQVIAKAAATLRAYCTTDCCWGREYDLGFPSDPCSFANSYTTILSSILRGDSNNSSQAKQAWNNCVRNNIESLKLCENLGKCAKIPPGFSRGNRAMANWCEKHFNKSGDQDSCWECISDNSPCNFSELDGICQDMRNCRGDSKLKLIDPPTGELADCLKKFQTGPCCEAQGKQTTKGMTKQQKQYFWEARADGKQNTTAPPARRRTAPPASSARRSQTSASTSIIPNQWHYGDCGACHDDAIAKARECRKKCVRDNTWTDPFGGFGGTKECEKKCNCDLCDAHRKCDSRPDCLEQIFEAPECVDCDPCEEADKRWSDCCCSNGCHMPPIRCRHLWEWGNGQGYGLDWWGDAGSPMWCSRCMGQAPGVPPCPGKEGRPHGSPYGPTDNYEDDWQIPNDPDGPWWGVWNPDGPYQGPWPGGGCGS